MIGRDTIGVYCLICICACICICIPPSECPLSSYLGMHRYVHMIGGYTICVCRVQICNCIFISVSICICIHPSGSLLTWALNILIIGGDTIRIFPVQICICVCIWICIPPQPQSAPLLGHIDTYHIVLIGGDTICVCRVYIADYRLPSTDWANIFHEKLI